MVSSFINLGWGRGTQMALCFKMILINQLHNQNALVSLFSLLFHGSQPSSEAGGREWQGLEVKPSCGEGVCKPLCTHEPPQHWPCHL